MSSRVSASSLVARSNLAIRSAGIDCKGLMGMSLSNVVGERIGADIRGEEMKRRLGKLRRLGGFKEGEG